MAGIKETLEATDAVFAFGEEAFKLAADGIQITDAVQLAGNPVLLAKAQAAYQGKELIADELKDISPEEAKELAVHLFAGVARMMKSAGFQPNGRVAKILENAPRILALAEHNYAEGKAIYEGFSQ